MVMRTSCPASVVLVGAFIITVGCKGDNPATRDATLETVLTVPPRSVPAGDAGSDRFDAMPAAAVVPPKTTRQKLAPSKPRKGGGGSGGGGSGVSAIHAMGNQPKSVVEPYLRGKVASLLACYAQTREQHPGQHGRLDLKLTMNERGVVELAEVVKSTISDDDGQMCLVQALQRFKFPQPPGGGQSTVTFQLGF